MIVIRLPKLLRRLTARTCPAEVKPWRWPYEGQPQIEPWRRPYAGQPQTRLSQRTFARLVLVHVANTTVRR